jgi:putative FmdB family regulatory protein
MPVYAFRCEECGDEFDVRATFAEKQAGLEPACPVCASRAVRQVMTAGLLIRGGAGSATARSGCAPTAGTGCCPW